MADTPAPDLAGLVERLEAITTSDHERGCQGREYSCRCGWDEETMAISTDAAARIRDLEAENARLKQEVLSFCAPHAARYAVDYDLPKGHLHPAHYDILKRVGARLDDFTRGDDA